MRKIFFNLGCVMYVVVGIGGVLLYAWSIAISFALYGFLGAVIVLCTPVLSQFFFFFKFWVELHTILNTYSVSWLLVVVFFSLAGILFKLGEEKEDYFL